MTKGIFVLFIAAFSWVPLANSQVGFSKIGKGCTTAYFIDNDCDGRGVAVRADGNYTTAGNVGDMPDADDNDPTVSTVADWRTKYGTGPIDTSTATLLRFLSTSRGYTPTRVWYVATTGTDVDCQTSGNYTTSPGDNINHPCADMGPMASVYHDQNGGLILYRGGTYTTGIGPANGPIYNPTASSAATPLIIMAYPGEAVVLNTAHGIDTANLGYWPGKDIANVIIDGFIFHPPPPPATSADCINQNDTNGWIFRNNEIVGYGDTAIRQNDHIENLLIEGNVFHDNSAHTIYLGYSSPTADPHTIGADFDFVQDAINYASGTSMGADHDITIRNNLSYRDGGGGYEPFHINSYINYITIEGNIIHSGSGSTGMGFQTGVYHATVRNNLIFNMNRGCAMTWSLYGHETGAPATHRFNTIINNTFWAGTTQMDTGVYSDPSCGILFNNYSFDFGTVSVTNGSSAVTWVSGDIFQATFWTSGDAIMLGTTQYTIASVADSTHFTLSTPYSGATDSNLSWNKQTRGLHWMKDFTINNNVIVSDNRTGAATWAGVPIVFCADGFPSTHTITHNVIWNNSITNPFTSSDKIMYYTPGIQQDSCGNNGGEFTGTFYDFTGFQAYSPNFNSNVIGNPTFSHASLSDSGSPQVFDLHLLSRSPAINLGTTTGAPSIDLQGSPRTGQPDAGAYEYVGNIVLAVPVISSFAATPSVIAAGASSTLSWSVSGATSLNIDQSIGSVSGTSITVSPTTATTYTLTATNSAGSTTKTASVSMVAGAPANLVITSGNNQSGSVGQALSNPYVVTVTDASGHAVSSVQVTFTIVSGGGTLSVGQTITNAQGQASSTLTLGATAGTNIVTATSGALNGSPVTFTATGKTSGGSTWVNTGPNWSNGVLLSTWPYFRGFNRLVYDPVLGQTLAAESENATTIYSDSYWAYNSTAHTWTQKTTTGVVDQCVSPLGSNPPAHPANRHPYHELTYDTARGRMYLFSGVCQGYGFTDTWAYTSSSNAWTQLMSATNPPGRFEGAMAYDAAHDVVVLYGGLIMNVMADTWQYSPGSNAWVPMSPGTNPGPVSGHSMVYDSVNKKIVLFGGYAAWGGPALNATWVYDAGRNTWTNPQPSTLPPGAYYPAMAFDSRRGLVVLYEGTSAMWTYNVATNQWAQLLVNGGPPPTDAGGGNCPQCLSLAYDSGTDKYVLTSQDASYYTATWELSLGSATTFDLNGDGTVNVLDVQIAIEQALGLQPCKTADFNGDGKCNGVDVQMIVNKAIGQ